MRTRAAVEAGIGAVMEFAVRFLGLELLHVFASTDSPSPEPEDGGDCMTYPIGFTASHELPDGVGLPDRWADE